MSPEQVRGEELDGRSDIFSFGTVFYELLSGRRPFEAKSTAEVISAILTLEPPPISSSGLDHIGGGEERLIRKCLEKDAGLRYQTMGDLISDLEQIRREHESGQVRPATRPTEAVPVKPEAASGGLAWRWSKGRKVELILAAVVLAVAAAVYTLSFRSQHAAVSGAKPPNAAAYDAY